MTTKEQERKALEQIRKIVAGLGEDSYIGIAFDGVLEDASENIENDFACSWKQRAMLAEKKAQENHEGTLRQIAANNRLRGERDDMEAACEAERASFRDQLHDLGDQLAAVTEARDSARDALSRVESERDDVEHKLLAAQDEILRLKARLFDLLYAE